MTRTKCAFLGIARATFCGLSLGGLTGFWLGAHAPERLTGLIVANASPRIAAPEVWEARIEQVDVSGMGAIAEAAPERWFSPTFTHAYPLVVARIQALVAATPPIGYAGCCAALRDADLWADLPAISVPTLLVAGRFDPVTTADEARSAAAWMPSATLVELPASHLSNLESASAFNQAVVAFAERQADAHAPR